MPTAKRSSKHPLDDFRLLLYLVIGLRLALLIAFQPEWFSEPIAMERGITSFGDFRQHYDFVRLSDEGYWPYRDYWVEFPPVWHGISLLVYQGVAGFSAWGSLLYLIMLGFDLGNLILLRKLGSFLYDDPIGLAIAWGYALLAASLIMLGWNFEVILLFSILGGLWWYFSGQMNHSAISIAMGILTKYIPLLILPLIWKFQPRFKAMRYTLLSLGLVIAVLVPIVAWGGDMAMQSLTVQFSKPPYQTVWALLEGNYSTGNFAIDQRFDPDPPLAHANLALTIIKTLVFGGIGLWLFWSKIAPTSHNQLAFFSLTVCLFMLWSGGWSPQWLVILAPLILLNVPPPSRLGILLIITLTIGALIEYPLLFRYSEMPVIKEAYRPFFAMLIMFRTAVLISIAAVLINRLVLTESNSTHA